jgi:hypothetical protein
MPMFDAQPIPTPVPAPPPAQYEMRVPELLPPRITIAGIAKCGPAHSDEIVVCGGRREDPHRLKPLPDIYQTESFLGHPFHLQIAPGLALDGLTLSAQFGPGAKSGSTPPAQPSEKPIPAVASALPR